MTHITLSLKDGSKLTPEIAAWLRAAEKSIQAEVDRVAHELLIFGHSPVLVVHEQKPMSDVARYIRWSRETKGPWGR
jgi:hypothetical protein